MTKLREMARELAGKYEKMKWHCLNPNEMGEKNLNRAHDVLETALRDVVEECMNIIMAKVSAEYGVDALDAIKTRFGLGGE